MATAGAKRLVEDALERVPTDTLKKPGKKVKEPEALKVMADYYRENRDSLPASVRTQRKLIVGLIMAGYSAQDAFSTVVNQRG